MQNPRWCLYGLGNYGQTYQGQRHNVGSACVDKLLQAAGLKWRRKAKFDYACGLPGRIMLCRSRLYINQSGEIWPMLQRLTMLPSERLIVIVDTLDLQPGELRWRQNGGSAGHNGLRSLISWTGGTGFNRIYLGIGRPASQEEVVPYVLGRPTAAERLLIANASQKILDSFSIWQGTDQQQLVQLLNQK